ncbi:hypothetical protein C21_00383 [Arenibacter sp. NBRC 103722]|uniref:hypothetical protein n=1 Tax=Arenibacter sp. NBRC 103722 TaxID=1113929 RepID=UPI000858CB6E|nr:hypothetical protein [Arenibacter sp. NBRC 103722]GBF18226.1 hypothetical protein C21_00383 [Arenibacter sp. NBRC 103722]
MTSRLTLLPPGQKSKPWIIHPYFPKVVHDYFPKTLHSYLPIIRHCYFPVTECYSHPFLPERDLIRRRNILFTAITRSKAWVRVYGYGQRMEDLVNEFKVVKKNNFKLNFKYPTKEDIERMNIIKRDITLDEEQIYKKEIDLLGEIPNIIERIKTGDSFLSDYPDEIQKILRKLM